MPDRTVVEKRVEAVADAAEDVAQARGGELACFGAGQVARTALQESTQGLRRDQPAIQQRGNPGAEAALAELREHQRHVVVFPRDAAADAERLVQRLGDETRDVGVGGEIEARIDVRFEWELAEEREAERVDRR